MVQREGTTTTNNSGRRGEMDMAAAFRGLPQSMARRSQNTKVASIVATNKGRTMEMEDKWTRTSDPKMERGRSGGSIHDVPQADRQSVRGSSVQWTPSTVKEEMEQPLGG